MWAFSLKLQKEKAYVGFNLHLFCHHVCCEGCVSLDRMEEAKAMEQQDGGTRAPDEKCTIISPWQGQLVGSHTKGKFGFHDKQQEKCH